MRFYIVALIFASCVISAVFSGKYQFKHLRGKLQSELNLGSLKTKMCSFNLDFYLFIAKDCVTPFANALTKLSAHANREGKETIKEMIAEMYKRSPCVARGDVPCIQKHLAQSVGIQDMIELEHDVEPKLRRTMAQIKAENEKAINKLKTMKSGRQAADLICNVRNTKAHIVIAI